MAKRYLSILFLAYTMLAVNAQVVRDFLSVEIEKYGQVEVSFEYPGFRTLVDNGKHISVDNIIDRQVIAFLSGNDLDYFVSLNFPYRVNCATEPKTVISATYVEEAMQW
ncbi:MAG: hypothetical protein K8R35_08025 [Bacteroidales bacterium]|nr:hypothetical protein [Bacteroidales bacterium]